MDVCLWYRCEVVASREGESDALAAGAVVLTVPSQVSAPFCVAHTRACATHLLPVWYCACFVSSLSFCLGFLWVLFFNAVVEALMMLLSCFVSSRPHTGLATVYYITGYS